MNAVQATLSTLRGDEVTVTLFQHGDEDPTVMITVDDADDSAVPTAEFTLSEVAELREILRKLEELASPQPYRRAG